MRGMFPGRPRVHYMSSFFLAKLCQDRQQYDYMCVRRWTALKNLKIHGQVGTVYS
jgi:Ulp1 family protease